jgi:carbonic anhydrase/acetyltransferase-like protein (isoleucine patch superfamily)
MAIYALGDLEPDIHPDAFVHPDATVIGRVTIGAGSSVWPSAVLRGDYGTITIGERSSVQDGSVLHAVPHAPTTVGSDVVVGHLVHLEGCTIEDWALIGSGSVVLHHCIVRSHSVVGANAVVPNGVEVPRGAMALGVPCTIKEGRVEEFSSRMSVAVYIDNAKRYKSALRRLS